MGIPVINASQNYIHMNKQKGWHVRNQTSYRQRLLSQLLDPYSESVQDSAASSQVPQDNIKKYKPTKQFFNIVSGDKEEQTSNTEYAEATIVHPGKKGKKI